MEFTIYYINFNNYELDDIQVQIKRLQSEPETTMLPLEASDTPAILETVNQDEDKTKSVRGRRLIIQFNSEDTPVYANADNFAEDDAEFQGKIITDSLAVPFLGAIVKEDISEAFQPRSNKVSLIGGDGFGKLKEIELTESDGDIPVGHYRIIDYIYLCLRNLSPLEPLNDLYVAMNLYEVDTDPDTSHAFIDINLDARTFETDVNVRDNCNTVLEKILDAFGCFITFDNSRYYIIRWDEWDNVAGDVTELRFAKFEDDGDFYVFQEYENINVDKSIAHDSTTEYEGFRLSQDNADKRYQIKAQEVKHVYRFEQPHEIPCNSDFLRGTVDDDVLPLKTYDPECWTLRRGWGANSTTPNSVAQIWVRYDANDDEDERYMTLTPQASSGGEFNYVRSEVIPLDDNDKFEFSIDYSADSDNGTNGPASIGIACLVLYGFDSSVWILGDNISALGDEQVPEWKLTNAELSVNNDYYQWFFSGTSGSEDYTEFRTYSIESPPAPVAGNLYVHLFAANQLGSGIDDFVIRYNNLQFTYIPFIRGSYGSIGGQQHAVTGNQSNKFIEKEMFISDSPKPLFKGALKKFDGVNYVLTEGWSYYNDLTVFPNERLAKHIAFQWWNTYRSTRTVIETDIQGLTNNIPSLINRWRIYHGNQDEKYFMLTSFTGMDFRNCGWHGVFVETSNGAGNRVYSDQHEFKYIQ